MASCLSYFLVAIVLAGVLLFGGGESTPPLSSSTPSGSASLSACLPAGKKLTDIVSVGAGGANPITVEQTLNGLGATCTPDGKLVDRTGKEIRFYQLTGCWGNPPENYLDILKKQADEIAQLKLQYTVIEMTCNPRGLLIQ